MRSLFFSLLIAIGCGPAIYAEDVHEFFEHQAIDFNDPAFVERVTKNMYFSTPDDYKNMSSEAQERAQNIMLGGND